MAKKCIFYTLFHEKLVILPLDNEEVDDFSTKIMKQQKKKKFILALGSNSNREQSMAKAMAMLQEELGDMTFTPMVETEAIGMEAPPFLNCLALGESDMTKRNINSVLKQIEQVCGDNATQRAECRIVMDIDLLLLGSKKYHLNDWDRNYVRELMAMLPDSAIPHPSSDK